MYACIVNPKAGDGKWQEHADYIRNNFNDIFITNGAEETRQIAKGLASRVNSLIVIGGDGTLSDVINGIMNTAYRPCIGIIPLGTGNAVKHEFGIKNIEDAVERIKKGKTREISLIKVNCDMTNNREENSRNENVERYCFFAGIGWDAEIVKLREKMRQELLDRGYKTLHKIILSKVTGYVIPVACKVFVYHPKYFEVDINGNKEKFQDVLSFLVSVFKHFGAGIRASPEADVFGENLTVTVYPRRLINNLANFINICYKTDLPARSSLNCQEIEIKGRDLPLELDGDYVGNINYARFTIVPRALKFFVR